MKKILLVLIMMVAPFSVWAQTIAVLKYGGGGDWYGNPTSLPNLIEFCNQNIITAISPEPATVSPSDSNLFEYHFLHMTGHGNVFFTEEEVQNLRRYLISGGFLHIDDNYGMNEYIRRELKKIFPDKELTEIPASHPIFSSAFPFPEGLPKIHEHDGLRPQAFALYEQDRMILLFTYESDLGDGWEDEAVHNDPWEIREKALKMGANIISYVFLN